DRAVSLQEAGQQRWWEQEITVNGNIQKGELITYNLTELIKPEAYEVRLTPITRFGEGDSTIRVIKYSAPVNPHLREFHCGFEDGNICLFTQDDTDNFDWTKQSTATRDTKYTPNTGPNADRTGSKEGKLQGHPFLLHWELCSCSGVGDLQPAVSFLITPR
uniref:MAM domain-containing protein n=1 Tax=Pavo cristatus TaxID=9049 RepID=A0A8C9L3U0_PAVCR